MTSANTTVPSTRAAAITTHDTNTIDACRGVYVGGAGDAVVEFDGGSGTAITLVGLVAGQVYPFRLTKVKVTGTTATNLVALY